MDREVQFIGQSGAFLDAVERASRAPPMRRPVLVIGERVLGMRRTHPGNWITNIQQGATAHPHRPTPREIEIARLAAARLGASLAGVDLLYDRSGHPWVIEVNACPGWQALASVSDVDISALVLEQVLSEVKPGLPQAP